MRNSARASHRRVHRRAEQRPLNGPGVGNARSGRGREHQRQAVPGPYILATVLAALLLCSSANAATVIDTLRFSTPRFNADSTSCEPNEAGGPCIDLAGIVILGQRSDACADSAEMAEHEVWRLVFYPLHTGSLPQDIQPPAHIVATFPVSAGVWWYRAVSYDFNDNTSCPSQPARHDLRPLYRKLLARSRARLANERSSIKWGPPRR